MAPTDLDRTSPEDVNAMEAGEPQLQGVPEARRGKGNRLLWLATAGVALVGITLFAILFPVLRNDNDSSSSSSTLTQGSNSPTTTKANTTSTTTGAEALASAFKLKGPLEGSISYFGPDVANGYSSTDALKSDLESAAKFSLTNTFYSNIGTPGFSSTTTTNTPEKGNSPSVGASGGNEALAPSASADASQSSGASSYETVNQEEGVEEGDIVVSDGTFVYAAYGDQIVIWTAATGAWVANVSMPPVIYNASEYVYPVDVPVDVPVAYENATGDDSSSSSSSSGSEPGSSGDSKPISVNISEDNATSSSGGNATIDIAPPFYWRPRAYINSLVLYESRLMAIVSGYGGYGGQFAPTSGRASPILYDYLATNVRLYDTSSLTTGGTLDLIGTADVNGYFNELREINGTAYIVTTTGIDTYTDLVLPFDRNQFQNISDAEYTEYVKTHADAAIKGFVDELVAEISVGGAVPELAKISLFSSEGGGNGTQVNQQLLFGDGLISNLVEVFSFDIMSTGSGSTLGYKASGLFTPSYWSQVYAVDGTLIIAGQGWNWIASTNTYDQSTYLVAMKLLPDGTTLPSSVGKLPGYILNDYSIDVVGTTLRIATTVQEYKPWIYYRVESDGVSGSDATGSANASTKEPTPVSSYPTMAPPTSTNYVVLFDVASTNGTMTELGRVQVGGLYESFAAVRFFDAVGYAVTNDGPFYVVDLSDSSKPTVVAQLNNTKGWSSNLYPASDDKSLLISIADVYGDNWVSEGLQITLFDVHVPTQPVALQKHVIYVDPNSTYSYSDSLWDVKSARFAAGRFILPVNIYNWVNITLGFQGFMVFDVNTTGIEDHCSIPFSNDPNATLYGCYCGGGSLPSRSMLFDGQLMTMNGQFVASTNFDTCARNWWLQINVTDTTNCCYGGGPIVY